MPRIPRLDEVDPIEFLVRQKFPNLGTMRSSGMRAPDGGPMTAGHVKVVEAEAERYRQKLERLASEEIDRLVSEAKATSYKALENRRIADEAKLWFNRPICRPDYNRWAVRSYWTLEEAIMLSLDRDPKKVQVKSVLSFLNVSNLSTQLSYRLELATRAKALKKMFDPVLPPLFVRWAQSCGIILPAELIESVAAAHGVHLDWEDTAKGFVEIITELQGQLESTVAENSELRAELDSKPNGSGQRERTSLLKLVAGMAVGGYGFDPKATRSAATREIADDLQRNGMPLDEDTIRKYLQLAKALLEECETE